MHHLELDLELDFERSIASGSVRLELIRNVADAPLVLDTMGLTIRAVHGADGTPREFALGQAVERFGRGNWERISRDVGREHTTRRVLHPDAEAPEPAPTPSASGDLEGG